MLKTTSRSVATLFTCPALRGIKTKRFKRQHSLITTKKLRLANSEFVRGRHRLSRLRGFGQAIPFAPQDKPSF